MSKIEKFLLRKIGKTDVTVEDTIVCSITLAVLTTATIGLSIYIDKKVEETKQEESHIEQTVETENGQNNIFNNKDWEITF